MCCRCEQSKKQDVATLTIADQLLEEKKDIPLLQVEAG